MEALMIGGPFMLLIFWKGKGDAFSIWQSDEKSTSPERGIFKYSNLPHFINNVRKLSLKVYIIHLEQKKLTITFAFFIKIFYL